MGTYADSHDAKVFFVVVFSLLILADVIGNTLVILVITKNKKARTPMNYLLVNLAVADMMMGLFIAPRFIFVPFFTHPEGTTGTVICKLVTRGNLAWTGASCSAFNLVAIAFERYYAAVYPYSRKGKMTMKKLQYIISGCWVGAVVVTCPLYHVKYHVVKNFCFQLWPSEMPWLHIAYGSMWLLAIVIMPISIMVGLYSKIIYEMWFKRGRNTSATQLAMLKYRKRATKIMITVSVIYVICWLPDAINYILLYLHSEVSQADVLSVAFIALITFNSAINPMVYTFQNERFRKHLKDLLFCKQGMDRVGQVPSNNTSNSRWLQ